MFEELITSIPEIKADKLALKPGIRVKLRRDGHSETLAAAHKMKLEDEKFIRGFVFIFHRQWMPATTAKVSKPSQVCPICPILLLKDVVKEQIGLTLLGWEGLRLSSIVATW